MFPPPKKTSAQPVEPQPRLAISPRVTSAARASTVTRFVFISYPPLAVVIFGRNRLDCGYAWGSMSNYNIGGTGLQKSSSLQRFARREVFPYNVETSFAREWLINESGIDCRHGWFRQVRGGQSIWEERFQED